MNKKISAAAVLAGVALISAGCSCPGDKIVKKSETATKVVVQTNNCNTAQVVKNKDIKVIFQDIHFNFDKYNLAVINKYGIKQNVPAVLDIIAEFMKDKPSINVRIEGNCDERGTEEYNLALGTKRAESARKYLISKGVSADRIKTVSYGESRPLDPAHNEKAWAKNRRDHFVILSR